MTKELRVRTSSRKTQNSNFKMNMGIGINNVSINILDSALKRLKNSNNMAVTNMVAMVIRKAPIRTTDE